jgi:Ca-activated chloride channel family protein
MNDFVDALEMFRFLRPAWLLTLPFLLLCGWWVRRRDDNTRVGEGVIASHLLGPLTVDRRRQRRFRPSDLIIAAAMLCAIAAAGPAWRRVIPPFFAETAPVVIALEVSSTMLASDVAPSRLERAKQKILDLIELRTGARTGLVAYAGSAHSVMPLTDDPAVLKMFLEGLDPEMMPVPGDKAVGALVLARKMLESEPEPGTIVFVTDGIPASESAAFVRDEETRAAGVVALVVGTTEGDPVRFSDGHLALGDDGRPLETSVDVEELTKLESHGVFVVRASVGGGDLARLTHRIRSNRERAGEDQQVAYRDDGHKLLLPAALIGLLWYRRGFTMQWMLLAILPLGLAAPRVAEADSTLLDLWLTPDQQGRLMMERENPEAAALLFVDPMWRGVAFYRSGNYELAAAAFGAVGSADGEFNLGNVRVRQREYRQALVSYESALVLDPEHARARANRDVIKEILVLLKELREGADSDGKVGADELKFDLEEGEGKQALIDSSTQLDVGSAEQWMREVETTTRDFLGMRFEIDLQHRHQSGPER